MIELCLSGLLCVLNCLRFELELRTNSCYRRIKWNRLVVSNSQSRLILDLSLLRLSGLLLSKAGALSLSKSAKRFLLPKLSLWLLVVALLLVILRLLLRLCVVCSPGIGWVLLWLLRLSPHRCHLKSALSLLKSDESLFNIIYYSIF